jgi:hypothetical protein
MIIIKNKVRFFIGCINLSLLSSSRKIATPDRKCKLDVIKGFGRLWNESGGIVPQMSPLGSGSTDAGLE